MLIFEQASVFIHIKTINSQKLVFLLNSRYLFNFKLKIMPNKHNYSTFFISKLQKQFAEFLNNHNLNCQKKTSPVAVFSTVR